jgi:hypothetical protein
MECFPPVDSPICPHPDPCITLTERSIFLSLPAHDSTSQLRPIAGETKFTPAMAVAIGHASDCFSRRGSDAGHG